MTVCKDSHLSLSVEGTLSSPDLPGSQLLVSSSLGVLLALMARVG